MFKPIYRWESCSMMQSVRSEKYAWNRCINLLNASKLKCYQEYAKKYTIFQREVNMCTHSHGLYKNSDIFLHLRLSSIGIISATIWLHISLEIYITMVLD